MQHDARTNRTTREALTEGEAGMDALWILSSGLVLSIVAAVVKTRRSAPKNLGFVSRDWVVRHGTDHPSV